MKKVVPDVGSYVAMSTICCLLHQAVTNIFPIICSCFTNKFVCILQLSHLRAFPDSFRISSKEQLNFQLFVKEWHIQIFLESSTRVTRRICCVLHHWWVGQIPVLLTVLSTTEENTSQPQTNCLFVLISHKHTELKYLKTPPFDKS